MVLLLWLSLIVGCGSETPLPSGDKPATASAKSKDGKAGKAKAKAKASAPRTAQFTVTDAGVGGLGAESPFTEAAITEALPGMRVVVSERNEEGNPFKVFQVLLRQRPAMLVWGDPAGEKVARIDISGPMVAGPNNERVGQLYRDNPRKAEFTCLAGAEGYAAHALCRTPGSKISLVYKPELWTGGPAELPKAADLDDARLVAMIWNPLLQ